MTVGDFLQLLEQMLGEDHDRLIEQSDLSSLESLARAASPDLTKN